jgi:hypothetical protein
MDSPVFDAHFYQTVLLDRVSAECQAHPEQIPAVLLSLADGAQLDLCHIARLADTWLAVACFRDRATCDDMDQIFLPYRVVVRVTLSLHHPQTHRLGFDVAKSRGAVHPGADQAPS